MAGYLVTWEKAKAFLNLDDGDKELAEFLINSASVQAEKIADRFLSARDVDITIDAHGGREYLLPSYPVNSVQMVRVHGSELPANEYSVRRNLGILRLKEQSPNGWDAIQFKGNIGYDPIPEDLQQAVLEIVSANRRRFTTSGGIVGIKSMTAGGDITTQYELDIPISARTVFMSYRGARV